MKLFKFFFSAFVIVLTSLILAPAAKAEELSKSEIKAVLTEFNKTLPQEITDGFSLTKGTYNDVADLLTITFSTEPSKLGVTLDEAKAEMNSLTNAEMKALLGNDLAELMAIIPCDVQIVITYPDNTSTKFLFKK